METLPAVPALASALLDIELDRQQTAQKAGPWQTGIHSLDSKLPRDLWAGGKVIGIASVDALEGDSLSAHLIATHLLSLDLPLPSNTNQEPSSTPPDPTTFIITPPGPSTALLTSIHGLFNTSASPLSLLATVSVLQYLDFAGLVESLAEVSASLHTTTSPKTLLLLSGLTPTLAALARRSTSSACALLASLQRQLTHLRRTLSTLLILLDLDLELVVQVGQAQLLSAFANLSGLQLRLGVGTGADPVGRTLERGLDVVVAVWRWKGEGEGDEKGREGVVVEVVKDRVGVGVGLWGVIN